MVDPITTSLILGGISQGIGNMFGQGGGGPVSVFTPEMFDQAIRAQTRFSNQNNTQRGTPSAGPGGVSTQQARKLSPQEVKANEYVKYLTSVKGYTEENARKEANRITKSKKRTFGKDKGFRQWIKNSGESILNTKKGTKKLEAPTQFEEAQVNVAPEAEMLRGSANAFNQNIFSSMNGLPQMFAGDMMRSLASRNNLGMNIQNQVMQPMNADGLTQSGQAQIDALKAKYLDEFEDLYDTSMRSSIGTLADTGFMSSNLAGDYLEDTALDAQSEFLTDAMAKLAGIESGLMDSNVARQTQALNNSINAFNSLGANQGMNSMTGAMVNPGGIGLFTDPQAAQAAYQVQQAGIQNTFNDQAQMMNLLTKPVTVAPEGAGFGSMLAGIAGPTLGGYAAAKLFSKDGGLRDPSYRNQ